MKFQNCGYSTRKSASVHKYDSIAQLLFCLIVLASPLNLHKNEIGVTILCFAPAQYCTQITGNQLVVHMYVLLFSPLFSPK